MHGTADFDERRIYRYRLARTWDDRLPTLGWIMLNPSTADGDHDDPTISRVVGFSRAWGFGAAHVVNLFALRASSPADLVVAEEPVGPDNDGAVIAALSACRNAVAAWGNHGSLPNPATGVQRSIEMWRLLHSTEVEIGWLRMTAEGQPGHPLYVRGDTRLVFS